MTLVSRQTPPMTVPATLARRDGRQKVAPHGHVGASSVVEDNDVTRTQIIDVVTDGSWWGARRCVNREGTAGQLGRGDDREDAVQLSADRRVGRVRH